MTASNMGQASGGSAIKRVLFAIPLAYWPNGFWTRDSGLVVLALRERGYDAWMVTLNTSGNEAGTMPVILASPEDLQNPDWWKAQHPDAVVLNTWSAPRYDAIRQAALAATPRVVERLDTDGVRSARLLPRQYCVRAWSTWCGRLSGPLRWLAGPLALGETSLRYLRGSFYDGRMAATMKRLPGLMAESPLAARRIRQILAAAPGPTPRVEVIPHPVNEAAMRYTGTPKENRIITVGRWASAQKDFPMVNHVLRDFLRRHADWTATVVGGNAPQSVRSENDREFHGRITYHERLDHAELAIEYNRSKIYLMASRYEAFCVAAVEALCCGCSVVCASVIAPADWFVETSAGTVTTQRTRRGFAEALETEVEVWAGGRRDPKAIAATWTELTGNTQVAQAILAFLEEIPNE